MFTVAVVGPDGAGKTAVSRRLASELGRPARYVYMGINLKSSRAVLPTTWLLLQWKRSRGRSPDLSAVGADRRPTTGWRGVVREGKALLRVACMVSEEVLRWTMTRYHLIRGRVVIFDRHFLIDYYPYDVAATGSRRLSRRLHGLFLGWLYDLPDLIIVLDAPVELLFARRPEGTVEARQSLRERYRELARLLSPVHVIDAARPLEAVVRDARDYIRDHTDASFGHARGRSERGLA